MTDRRISQMSGPKAFLPAGYRLRRMASVEQEICIKKGEERMKELITEAKRENLPKVLAFVDGQLEAVDCPMLTQTSIDVAVEELFINIASYAYDMENGTAVVQVTVLEDPLSVEITFIDNGQQYDPLAREDPDITLPKQKRKKGGLGIFMVKKTMDDVHYEYKDGRNILTIRKNLNEGHKGNEQEI